MKCFDCPFLENAGTYEYPEMVCRFFYCEVPEEFDNKEDDGCNLKFKEAMKLGRLYSHATGAMYNAYIEELKKRRLK